MDKNAIKKYAVWARTELITRVSQRAEKYEITADSDANASSVNGVLLSEAEKKQRKALIEQVKQKGFDQVMEEVAYTWFNRFIALRFMEVNGYLPSHIRVFTDDNNNFKPQILTEAIHLELDGLDMDKVYEMKNNNENDELYKYLIIIQCNELSKILPGMFQKISDYTELLFPDNILREGSVIEQMVAAIPENDWTDQVQIVGWLYQYYNSEPKDKVFSDLKKNIKVTKEKIPAATQLFTPDWIVRYMVENSLGRLWVEGHPSTTIDSNWKYFLPEAEQTSDVKNELESIHRKYAALKPEDILCIDPSSGSGHILAYMFDVLIQIYEDYGIATRDAVKNIVLNNIWGLDIDDRAAQLAYFSVMMKGVQYDRRFLNRKDENGNPDVPQPHVYSIKESNNIDELTIEYFCKGDKKLKHDIEILISELHDAKEYGSILNISQVDFDAIYSRFNECKDDINISSIVVEQYLYPLVQVAQALSQKYDVLVTNPPYIGCRNINDKLNAFIESNYPESKSDLFSCFLSHGIDMVKKDGFNCMVTMQSWMFLSSFEQFRKKMFTSSTITSLLHMDNMVMGIAFGTSATIFRKEVFADYMATYTTVNYDDLNTLLMPEVFPVKENAICHASIQQFERISGQPVAYWLSDTAIKAFDNKELGYYAKPRQGMATSDNNRFLRLWFEVDNNKICLDASNSEEAQESGKKWFPYNKGGSYRKWYGNNYYLINWEKDGCEVKELAQKLYKSVTRTIKNIQFYFQEGVTWSTLSSGSFSARYCDKGYLFDTKGSTCFFDNKEMIPYCIAFLNCNVATALLKVLAPTMDFNAGAIAKLPIKYEKSYSEEITKLVNKAISITKNDWDSFETSWDFKKHPLVQSVDKIETAFNHWRDDCDNRFNELKQIEEKLNKIYIDIYGMEEELTPYIDDKDVSVYKADPRRDIESFISYAVGCMFGRYSLDKDGILYAGGQLDYSNYQSFVIDKDGIIPICDDEYFEDDITGLFVKFVETVYGDNNLEINLDFIAKALGGTGTSREIIRHYFLNDFFLNHCTNYSVAGSGKRPIYWLFDSGKNNGFKCLIYMHRYQSDTIARIRTDYVHEQQARYKTAIEETENRLLSAEGSDKVKLSKKLKHLKEQDEEIHTYEEKIHHLADQMIPIDLDDGVKVNYAKFEDVLAKIK